MEERKAREEGRKEGKGSQSVSYQIDPSLDSEPPLISFGIWGQLTSVSSFIKWGIMVHVSCHEFVLMCVMPCTTVPAAH